MATNQELYQSILTNLKRIEPLLESTAEGVNEELTEADETLSNLADYIEGREE